MGAVLDTAVETTRADGLDPGVMPLERVEAEICTLAGQIAAATSRFLRLLADFDAREGWAGTGTLSCAHWLSWRCGLSLHTAHEHVRTARRLQELPQTREAFAQGRISYSKVRAIVRVATPDNEPELVDAALHSPASHLDRLVRGLRTAQRNSDDDERRRGRGDGADGSSGGLTRVRWRWDDDGSLRVWGRLSAEDGARLLAGLTRMDQELRRNASDAGSDPAGGGWRELGPAAPTSPQDGSREAASRGSKTTHPGVAGVAPADLGAALVAGAELMCTAVDTPVHAPAADVVVHVDAETLVQTARGAQDRSAVRPPRVDDGPALRDAVLQMLACDGRIRLSVHGVDGRSLALGRKRRRPNAAQLSALWRRDRGCAAPGCARTRFLHAHHVLSWALGGATDLDNMVLLCGEHHRALHDGELHIVALGHQRFRFHGPGGAVRPQAPAMSGDAAALVAAHADITPDTIEPDWDGSPLHLHDAVNTYLTNWAVRARWRQDASRN